MYGKDANILGKAFKHIYSGSSNTINEQNFKIPDRSAVHMSVTNCCKLLWCNAENTGILPPLKLCTPV